jgi:hypothetical protein
VTYGIAIRQVGKRWFHCLGNEEKPLIEVEASYGDGINYVLNEKLSLEAGYSVYDWIPFKKWNLTGKGARKFREQIITALEQEMEVTP